SSLGDALDGLEACRADCLGVIYFWSPRMPLSRSGIPNIERAARTLGAELTLVGFEELERYAEAGAVDGSVPTAAAEAILAAGALTHAPSLVVHKGSRVIGPAILGYKETAAYESMVATRLAEGAAASSGPEASLLEASPGASADVREVTDYPAIGVPGAYFRWVPGRQALAYESAGRVYLLDLRDGENRVAPGFIDFVPTPDGEYFVTPGSRNAGLGFFDADEVFDATFQGRSASVGPVFVDERMRDQYPSVGILAQDDASVRYRVMTSWFEGLLYRDYEVRRAEGGGRATVQPLGPPVVPCAGTSLSTPIMSQDGTEVAARDEATGTTKIYRILPEGRCEEALALGMPTRKVAWHSTGRKLAFSTPRVRSISRGGVEPGIFVYDREARRVTRVADSDGASQLAFPDFIGEEAVVFMVPGRSSGQQSYFRVVRPIP
ncbi:MAG: hypothetical protein OEN00_01050, partial [Gemmatimonadota bacterium]|nr:hypothetical protein [Gemmatimonadota bacterium]